MVGCLQQKCLIVTILANCILLCFGTECEGECCYSYSQFPATPPICNGTIQTRTVTLSCEVQYGLFNNSINVEVKWYRSRDEESAGIDGELLVSNDQCTQYNRNLTSIMQCRLGIMNFDINDVGYYWCQMVVNNVSLSPSPYGHIHRFSIQCTLLDVVCNKRDEPYCAQNRTTRYMARTLEPERYCSLEDASVSSSTTTTLQIDSSIAATSRSTMTSTSIAEAMTDSFDNTTKSTVSTLSSKYPTIIIIDSLQCNSSKEGYPCLIGVASGIILLLAMIMVVLGISFSFFWIKRKNQIERKPDDTLELEECNEFANPHYSEVRVAINDSLKQKTEADDGQGDNGLQREDSGLSKPEYDVTQQYQRSPNSHETDTEERSQLNGCSGHIKNQEAHNATVDLSSVYAVVNNNKKTSNLQNTENLALKADLAKGCRSPEYDRLNQDESTEPTAKRTEDKDLQDRSPSPEYAELSTRENKVPIVAKCLMETQNESKSDSHEYDKFADMAQASMNVTKGDAEEVEQHYYYTLENPEESCSNSKRKEETTKTTSSGEMEYNIPQAHLLVKDNVPIASNTDTKAELVSVREVNRSPP